MNHRKPTHTAIATAVLVTASVASFGAMAAKPGAAERAEIQQTYRAERMACTDGSTSQDRGACLAEAAAVRKEALAGVLGVQRVDSQALAPQEADLLANALTRCDAVPSDVRGDCERRVVGGEGVVVVGSVEEGAVITELVAIAPEEAEQDVMLVAMSEGNLGQAAADATAQPMTEASPAEEGYARGTTLYYGPVTQDGEQSRVTEYSAIDQTAEPMVMREGDTAQVDQANPADQTSVTVYEEAAQPPMIVAEPTEPVMEAPPEAEAPVSTLPEPTPQGSGFEPGPTETFSPSWQVQQRFQ